MFAARGHSSLSSEAGFPLSSRRNTGFRPANEHRERKFDEFGTHETITSRLVTKHRAGSSSAGGHLIHAPLLTKPFVDSDEAGLRVIAALTTVWAVCMRKAASTTVPNLLDLRCRFRVFGQYSMNAVHC